jgi:hypothetical protein
VAAVCDDDDDDDENKGRGEKGSTTSRIYYITLIITVSIVFQYSEPSSYL